MRLLYEQAAPEQRQLAERVRARIEMAYSQPILTIAADLKRLARPIHEQRAA
jgi:hypothetical protein